MPVTPWLDGKYQGRLIQIFKLDYRHSIFVREPSTLRKTCL
jgi:hypothetical protein